MTIENFQSKLKELYLKAKFSDFISDPFVFDADQHGQIYINSEGKIFFVDKLYNWKESPLQLSDMINMRYSIAYDEPWHEVNENISEPTESYVHLYFSSGERIELIDFHDGCGNIFVEVSLSDEGTAKKLQNSCGQPNSMLFNTFTLI